MTDNANQILSQAEAAEFMVRKAGDAHHPGLVATPGTGVVFDSSTQRFHRSDSSGAKRLDGASIYHVCMAPRDALLHTVNQYRKKLKLPPLKSETKQSWQDVESDLQIASEGMSGLAATDKAVDGFRGKIKQAFRGMCKSATALDAFTFLVPSEFGFGSVLCGSLRLILRALETSQKFREEVYGALEWVPYVIKVNAERLSIYPDDEELHRHLAVLYASLFKLLNHILLWFLENNFVTATKVLFNSQRYLDALKDRRGAVELAEQNFRRRAELLCEHGHDESRQLQYMQIFMQGGLNKGVESVLEELRRTNHRLQALESMKQMMVDGQANADESARRKSKKMKRADHRIIATAEPSMNPEGFLGKLEYEPDRVPNDCMALLKYETQPLHDQLDSDRVNNIRNNVRLVNWLCLDKASLLLLNGRSTVPKSMDTSLVFAQLYAGLAQLSSNKALDGSLIHLPLVYFGSQYYDTNDPNAWPIEVAMSILCQLIDHYANFSSTVLNDTWDNIDATSISSIMMCFEKLLSDLPEGIYVIVMIEGLETFSNQTAREKKMRHLVKRLVEIWRRRDRVTKATLKFVFASSTRGDYVEDLFNHAEDQILDLPAEMPETEELIGHLSLF